LVKKDWQSQLKHSVEKFFSFKTQLSMHIDSDHKNRETINKVIEELSLLD